MMPQNTALENPTGMGIATLVSWKWEKAREGLVENDSK